METTDCCDYKLSIALKAAGFDEPCKAFYEHIDGKMYFSVDGNEDWNSGVDYSAPHIYHVQKWLRKKYGLHVVGLPCMDSASDTDGQVCDEWQFWFFDIMQVSTARFLVNGEGRFDSYEQALTEGIKSALELIKKGE